MSHLQILVPASAVVLIAAIWFASGYGQTVTALVALGGAALIGVIFFSLMGR